MGKNKPNKRKAFRLAVLNTPDVKDGYCPGITALGKYKDRIICSDPANLGGSVDIDLWTTKKYPTENRWDYALGFKGEAFFIEVHSAHSSEVKTVLRKLAWLKHWLQTAAPEIDKITMRKKDPFYWIQSGNFQIPQSTPQYRAAIQAQLKPVKILALN